MQLWYYNNMNVTYINFISIEYSYIMVVNYEFNLTQ